MYPAWDAPINAALPIAMYMFGEKARRIGASPLTTPKFRNNLPLVVSLVTPDSHIKLMSAPHPIDIIIRLKSPPPVALNLSTDRTGRTASNDIVKPQWKNAMSTINLRIGCL